MCVAPHEVNGLDSHTPKLAKCQRGKPSTAPLPSFSHAPSMGSCLAAHARVSAGDIAVMSVGIRSLGSCVNLGNRTPSGLYHGSAPILSEPIFVRNAHNTGEGSSDGRSQAA